MQSVIVRTLRPSTCRYICISHVNKRDDERYNDKKYKMNGNLTNIIYTMENKTNNIYM